MAPRTFLIAGDDGFAPDRDELGELVADLIGSIHRLGGMFSVAAHRQEIAPNQFETTAFVVTHDKHSPAEKLPKPVEDVQGADG